MGRFSLAGVSGPVITRNSAGNLEDRPFHLLVLC